MPKMRSHSGAKKSRKRKDSLRQGAYMASNKEARTIKSMIQK